MRPVGKDGQQYSSRSPLTAQPIYRPNRPNNVYDAIYPRQSRLITDHVAAIKADPQKIKKEPLEYYTSPWLVGTALAIGTGFILAGIAVGISPELTTVVPLDKVLEGAGALVDAVATFNWIGNLSARRQQRQAARRE